MGAKRSTADVAAARSRLTGDPGRTVKHGKHFRLKVTSSNGKPATVVVQIDTHPAEARPYVLNDIADRFRLPRDEIDDVLDHWTQDKLVKHLEQFTHEQLKPPALRKC